MDSGTGTTRPARCLVVVDGHWQTGDVVKQSTFGMWSYMTLDRDGWRDSTPTEITAFERTMKEQTS